MDAGRGCVYSHVEVVKDRYRGSRRSAPDVFFLLMLLIRSATVQDAALLRTMIRELAEFERELDLCVIEEADLVRDGFGANPKFRALIAEWEGQPAVDCFWRIFSCGNSFAVEESGERCWLRWRALRCRRIVTECTGKCSTGMRRRLNCTSLWERSSATNGGQ